MCRLLGILVDSSTNFNFSLKEGSYKNLESLSGKHKNGWGVAYRQDDAWIVRKSPLQALADDKFAQASVDAVGKLMISHIRLASSGEPKLENTHPFEMQGWVFAHNGTISDKEKLFGMISDDIKKDIKGDTDSERYFGVLLSAFNDAGIKAGASPEKVADVLAEVLASKVSSCQSNGLNFLLSDGTNIYAFKKDRPLFQLNRDGQYIDSKALLSDDVRVVLGEKAKKGEKAVLIASEQLTEGEDWKEVPETSLLWIDSKMVVRSKQLAI